MPHVTVYVRLIYYEQVIQLQCQVYLLLYEILAGNYVSSDLFGRSFIVEMRSIHPKDLEPQLCF